MGLRHGGEHILHDPAGSCACSTVELPVSVWLWLSQLHPNPSFYRTTCWFCTSACCHWRRPRFPFARRPCLYPARDGRLGTLPTASTPGGLRLVSTFHKGCFLQVRCQRRVENHVNVLNFPLHFSLKSKKKKKIILN